jgi:hypothetical protein
MSRDAAWLRTAASTNAAQMKAATFVRKAIPTGPAHDLAVLMETEHRNALNQIRMLASRLGLKNPRYGDPLMPAHRRAVDAVRWHVSNPTVAPGLAVAYARWTKQGHVGAVRMYEREIRSGKNADVRKLAVKQKPSVVMHGRKAAALLKRLVPAIRR